MAAIPEELPEFQGPFVMGIVGETDAARRVTAKDVFTKLLAHGPGQALYGAKTVAFTRNLKYFEFLPTKLTYKAWFPPVVTAIAEMQRVYAETAEIRPVVVFIDANVLKAVKARAELCDIVQNYRQFNISFILLGARAKVFAGIELDYLVSGYHKKMGGACERFIRPHLNRDNISASRDLDAIAQDVLLGLKDSSRKVMVDVRNKRLSFFDVFTMDPDHPDLPLAVHDRAATIGRASESLKLRSKLYKTRR